MARNVHVFRAFQLITDMFSPILYFLLELGFHGRCPLIGHRTLCLPEHFISLSALFFVGRLLCQLSLSPTIMFAGGLMSTLSHSPRSVSWYIITLTEHRKSIGINY
jgi:hypothetical protein